MFNSFSKLLPILALGIALPAMAQNSAIDKFCDSLEDASSQHTKAEIESYKYLCALPKSVRARVPKIYLLSHEAYQAFLEKQPITPQAPANISGVEGRAEVSRAVSHSESCHFYSMTSPTFDRGGVVESDKTKIVHSAQALLQACQILRYRIRVQEKIKLCHVIELAGHSTQAIGLDTILGIDGKESELKTLPSEKMIGKIGECFRDILEPGAPVIFSSCGGEWDDKEILHFWPNKSQAQQKLTDLLKLPIISGVGPVHGSDTYSFDGVESNQGWFKTSVAP